MKLEQQVCSPELAMRLKQLGAKQTSAHHWFHLETETTGEWKLINEITVDIWKRKNPGREVISAFTVAELGNLLPATQIRVTPNGRELMHYFVSCHEPHEWQVSYQKTFAEEFLDGVYFGAQTEADARAKMLVYLIENGLIIVPA